MLVIFTIAASLKKLYPSIICSNLLLSNSIRVKASMVSALTYFVGEKIAVNVVSVCALGTS